MIVYVIGFILTIYFAYHSHSYYRVYCNNKEKYLNNQVTLYKVKESKRTYLLFLLLAILPLGLISGFRYGIGTDYFYTYSPNFYKILNGESPYSEFGFNLLNRIIQLFSHKDTALFLVTSLIFSVLLVKTIIKYSNNVIFSFVVVFISCIYFISLNNVRQSIASIIMLASFPYFMKRDTIKVLLCCLIGMVFHYTSIIILIAYIACHIKFIQKHFLLFCIAAIISLPILALVFKQIASHTKYYYYFISDFNNNRSTTILILYNFIFFALFLIRMYKFRLSDKRCHIFLMMQFFALWFSLLSLFVPISEMISRIVNFFLVFQVLAVPYMGLKTNFKSNRLAFNAIYITAYSTYMIYYIVIMGYHAVLPYYSIFSLGM